MAAEDVTRTVGAPVEESQQAAVCLLVVGGSAVARHVLPPSGEVTLGRGSDVTIPLADSGASRRHAIIHMGPPLRLEDLGSKNGTRLCGRRLRARESVALALGDVVQIGNTALMVQRASTPDRPLLAADEFAARLQAACDCATDGGSSFTVVRFMLAGSVPATGREQILTDLVRGHDAVGAGGPTEYSVLLADTSAEAAHPVIQRTIDRLQRAGIEAGAGAASYPRDGRDAEALLSAASASLRGHKMLQPSRAIAVTSGPMQAVLELAERAAHGQLPILITGETGVGKEVLAERVHRLSSRRAGPFLCLNCAAFPETLLESELFGHERGAFTGAAQVKPGLLEAAAGGSVFLDEIGELPLHLQAKLLRVFESKQVLRLGALTPRAIDVRFVSATHRSLEQEIEQRRFRQDLYYRLSGLKIAIPPLRERTSEILPLAQLFLDEACAETGRAETPSWSDEARAVLERHRWPGNIRELRNVVERAVLLCAEPTILAKHLPPELTQVAAEAAPAPEARLRDHIDQVERRQIEEALAQCNGNQTRAAQLLGIARNTLIARLETYGIARPRKKR